ncbi:Ulp1 protease family, carboxy-terminal domain protein [Arachis hypogaea]|nr:Ulp1 protease family, carboxy-terminal domain protein [Arachis hypogaea]
MEFLNLEAFDITGSVSQVYGSDAFAKVESNHDHAVPEKLVDVGQVDNTNGTESLRGESKEGTHANFNSNGVSIEIPHDAQQLNEVVGGGQNMLFVGSQQLDPSQHGFQMFKESLATGTCQQVDMETRQFMRQLIRLFEEEKTPTNLVPSGIHNISPIAPNTEENLVQAPAYTNIIRNRLFRTPFTRKLKKEKGTGLATVNSAGNQGPTRKSPPLKRRCVGQGSRRTNATTKSGRNKFKVTPAMDFNDVQARIFAYIFNSGVYQEEYLVKMGEMTATRKIMHSLLPENDIDELVVQMLCKNVTLAQFAYPDPYIWCLPPTFAEDVHEKKSQALMQMEYMDTWIKASTQLQYIYVPIEDLGANWFAMVIGMHQEALYYLDSNPQPYLVRDRKARMRDVAKMLFKITTECFDTDEKFLPHGLPDWPIIDGKGIPNCRSGTNSASWVISWINMENQFDYDLPGMLEHNLLRAKLAVDLVTSPFNQLKNEILKDAIEWEKHQVGA